MNKSNLLSIISDLLPIVMVLILCGSVISTVMIYDRIPEKTITKSVESREYVIEFEKPIVIMNYTVEKMEVFYENETVFLHQHNKGNIQDVHVDSIDNITLQEQQTVRVLYPKEETAPISSAYETENFDRVKMIEVNAGGVRVTHNEKENDSFMGNLCFVSFMLMVVSSVSVIVFVYATAQPHNLKEVK